MMAIIFGHHPVGTCLHAASDLCRDGPSVRYCTHIWFVALPRPYSIFLRLQWRVRRASPTHTTFGKQD